MKILFFSPHSAVWLHAFPEALVAEALAQQGNEIVYVSCGELLNRYCIAMSPYGVSFASEPSAKRAVCRLCKRNERVLRRSFGFDGPKLAELLTTEDERAADSIVASLTRANCLDLSIEGIEVGRIASYELFLQNKKTAAAFGDAEWADYTASVHNAILILRIAQRLFASVKPDRVVVYNALYSVNRIVSRIAELQGVEQYFLHAGDNLATRLQTLILARGHAFGYYERLRQEWSSLRDRPVSKEGMRAATDHLLEVVRGRSLWAYSAAAGGKTDLRQYFSIDAGQKVICATMSSNDERFSGEIIGALRTDIKPLFQSQVEWIKALIRFVEVRPHLSLIVRVHPREFPNKREGVLSEHGKMLKTALSSLPVNVKVNWPADNVSLYDLASIADAFVNAWSSAGKEMAWLGLPVVLYSDELTLYPADLNYVGKTEAEYFACIERALADGWSAERIRTVYRWCALEYKYGALDISDSYSGVERRTFAARAVSKLLRMSGLSWEQRANCRARAERLRAAPSIKRLIESGMHTALELNEFGASVSYSMETEYLRVEVRRLYEGLFSGEGANRENGLARRMREFIDSK